MPSVIYSYTKLPTDEGIIYRPIIPVKIVHKEMEFPSHKVFELTYE